MLGLLPAGHSHACCLCKHRAAGQGKGARSTAYRCWCKLYHTPMKVAGHTGGSSPPALANRHRLSGHPGLRYTPLAGYNRVHSGQLRFRPGLIDHVRELALGRKHALAMQWLGLGLSLVITDRSLATGALFLCLHRNRAHRFQTQDMPPPHQLSSTCELAHRRSWCKLP